MPKIIYKYTLRPESGRQTILMRSGAILDVQAQHGAIALWVGCDPYADEVQQRFFLVLTGYEFELPQHCSFLKTIQFDDGNYVIHIFHEKFPGEVA